LYIEGAGLDWGSVETIKKGEEKKAISTIVVGPGRFCFGSFFYLFILFV